MGVRGQAGPHPLRDGRRDARSGRRSTPAGRAQASDPDALRHARADGDGRMKTSQMREKTADELQTREKELSEQLYKLRFQRATGRMEAPSKVKEVRREIARIKTLLGEKARG